VKKIQCHIIDTYEDFLTFWTNSKSKDVDEQVSLWQVGYMKKYPELLTKQIKNYEEMNIDWQDVAKKTMRLLPQRLKLMQTARDNILQVCKPIYTEATERLGLDFNVTFTVYVGIGCGAGWATTYDNQPAVLLGLENIAEEKWHTKTKLQGLISHEIGHLAHMKWRNTWESFDKACDNPFFRLYTEGFATRCEQLILGKESWHMAPGKGWRSWCRQHKNWLAKEFLKRLEKQAPVNDFFGSWFSIQGRKQTGYFLGHGFIYELEKTYAWRDIALLDTDTVGRRCKKYLRSISVETDK